MKKYLCLAVISVLFLNGCSYMQNLWPFGDDISEKETIQDEGSYLAVNPYLWQASLDKLAFMPLASSDAKGGVIITDWKSMSGVPDEQFKVNVVIHTRELRVDGLKVEVFERKFVDGKWTDAHNNSQLANELEKAILYRARELFRSDVISR